MRAISRRPIPIRWRNAAISTTNRASSAIGGFKLTSGIGGGVQLRTSELSYLPGSNSARSVRCSIPALRIAKAASTPAGTPASAPASTAASATCGAATIMRWSIPGARFQRWHRRYRRGYNLSSDIGLTLNLARQVGGEEESAFGSYAVHRIGGLGANWRIRWSAPMPAGATNVSSIRAGRACRPRTHYIMGLAYAASSGRYRAELSDRPAHRLTSTRISSSDRCRCSLQSIIEARWLVSSRSVARPERADHRLCRERSR